MIFLVTGVLLVAVSWFIAWTQTSSLAVYYFPPLWTGYILFLNGLGELLYRDSLIRRMGWSFLLLFVLSVPLWWFFEYLNASVQNWYYLFPEQWSKAEQIILKTVSFATIIPAVYSSSFLLRLFLKDRFQRWNVRISLNNVGVLSLGILTFILMYIYPEIFFPFVWIAPLLILDSLSDRFGFPSILGELREGKWSIVIAFTLGTLLTGFFWEMWNFYAFPKWFYTIPLFDFLKIFEMPIVGYGGYIPFGLFVFTFTSIAFALLGRLGVRIALPRF